MLVQSKLDWNLAFQWRSVLKHMTLVFVCINRKSEGTGAYSLDSGTHPVGEHSRISNVILVENNKVDKSVD